MKLLVSGLQWDDVGQCALVKLVESVEWGFVCLFSLRCAVICWLMYMMNSIFYMACNCDVDLNEICSIIWGQECANLVLPVSITILSRKKVLSALCRWISMATHYGRSVSTSSCMLYSFSCYFESSRTHTDTFVYVHLRLLTWLLMAGWKGVLLLFEEWAVQVWCYVQISSPWTGGLAVSSTITRSGYTSASSSPCTLCLSSCAVSICSFVTTIWSNTCKVSIAAEPICSWPLWSYVGFPRGCSIPKLESLPSMCSSLTCHFVSFYPCT